MFVTLYETGEVHFCLLGSNGIYVKAENEKFIAAGLRCRENRKYEKFTASSDRLRQKLHQKSCRTRSTILFFIIQPIKLLICGVAVVVAVVIS